jgi:hypothetical protein
MAQYRKKPVTVEAVQLNFANWPQICKQLKDIIGPKNPGFIGIASSTCGELGLRGGQDPTSKEWLSIKLPTLEGTLIANHGDYIIKGTHGEFYPCKPNIFWSTYESVAESQND